MKRSIHELSGWGAPLLLAWACACGSTGVGNPGPIATGTLSLAIVSDDELDTDTPDTAATDTAATDTAATDTAATDTAATGTVSPAAAGDSAAAAPADVGEPSEVVEPLPRGSLQRAVLVLGSVRWLPCDGSAQVVTQSGPFIVDLLAGETRPPLPAFSVPTGGLCGFEAPLAPARASAEILGRSLWFSGVRADGARFVLFANMRATLRVRAPQGQVWGGAEDASLLWAMRPRRWAAPHELANEQASESDGQRTLVIDADRHPLLFALIRARLASQSHMFFDRDGDGVLDTAERSEGQVGTGTTDSEE